MFHVAWAGGLGDCEVVGVVRAEGADEVLGAKEGEVIGYREDPVLKATFFSSILSLSTYFPPPIRCPSVNPPPSPYSSPSPRITCWANNNNNNLTCVVEAGGSVQIECRVSLGPLHDRTVKTLRVRMRDNSFFISSACGCGSILENLLIVVGVVALGSYATNS
ncbi:hypothetical protein FHG87_001674 [Trinorchestia longiramus]|nr:hypothetical protein FHG87_001674 [Trinorchestia longiramus]